MTDRASAAIDRGIVEAAQKIETTSIKDVRSAILAALAQEGLAVRSEAEVEAAVAEWNARALAPALDTVIEAVEAQRKPVTFSHWDTGETVMADPRTIAYALRAMREAQPATHSPSASPAQSGTGREEGGS